MRRLREEEGGPRIRLKGEDSLYLGRTWATVLEEVGEEGWEEGEDLEEGLDSLEEEEE
jgi:hypothetical protein